MASLKLLSLSNTRLFTIPFKKIFETFFSLFLQMFVSVGACAHVQVFMADEGVTSFEARIIGGCELTDMGNGNHTSVL